jgi:hypothetical protein
VPQLRHAFADELYGHLRNSRIALPQDAVSNTDVLTHVVDDAKELAGLFNDNTFARETYE